MANSVFLDLDRSGSAFIGQMVGPAADNTAAPPYSFLGDLTTGYGSSSAGVLDLMLSGSKGLELSTSAATFLSGIVGNFQRNAIATTPADALILSNGTAATSGATVQISPRLRFRANVWNTGGTPATNTDDWETYTVPASATTPTSQLILSWSANGASYVQQLALDSTPGSQTATFAGQVNVGSNLRAPATGAMFFQTGTVIRGVGNGTTNLTNNAETAGIGIDVATDAVLKVRTRAQTGYATLDCLGLKASGAAGFNGTVTPVNTITVVNGIVTNVA